MLTNISRIQSAEARMWKTIEITILFLQLKNAKKKRGRGNVWIKEICQLNATCGPGLVLDWDKSSLNKTVIKQSETFEHWLDVW